MRTLVPYVISTLLACSWAMTGCRADPDDAAGQAKELEDPVRRQNAVVNLHRIYTAKLAAENGNRKSEGVKAVADAIYEQLVKVYIEHPEDSQNGLGILDLMKEMRDPRTIPALIKALDWRTEVSEEHAIRAAQTFQFLEIPGDKKAEVIAALGNALEKVTQKRQVDDRMRIEFIRALGETKDAQATKILVEIATKQSEEQNFHINRLAAQQIGRIGDESAVPAMIKGLFLFAPNNPGMRMNDVAAEVLVRIGRPAYAPLIQVLEGKHEEANAITKQFIEAVKRRNEAAAGAMSVRQITSGEATFALGALGFRDALEPLLAEAKSDDIDRRLSAAVALVRLNLQPADMPRVRDAIRSVYQDAPIEAKPQLIAAMRHLYDSELQPFFVAQVRDRDLHPDVRIAAVTAHALLADKAEAAQLKDAIAKEPSFEDGGYRENFTRSTSALLEAADACDKDVECWRGKLADKNKLVLRKAAYMLGKYGRGDAASIEALVQKLDHSDVEVRLAAIAAIDRIAAEGSPSAVEKIEKLRQAEEGRAIWVQFSREALPIQARLRTRTSG